MSEFAVNWLAIRRHVSVGLTVLFCYVLAQAVHAHAMVQGNVGACDTPSKCRFDGKSDFIVKDDPTALRQGALLAVEALHLNPTEENDRRLRSLMTRMRNSRLISKEDSAIRTVAVSPNGLWFSTGSQDGYVRLFQLATWKEVRHWQRKKAIVALAFSPNSRHFAVASEDGTADVFDTQTLSTTIQIQHKAAVRAVAFSPDSLHLLSGGDDGSAVLSDLGKEHSTRHSLLQEKGAILCVEFSPDGQHFIIGTSDGKVRVFDTKNAGGSLDLPEHKVAVRQIKFSPDGAWIGVGSDDHTVSVFDLGHGGQKTTFPQNGSIRGIDFAFDSRWLAVTSSDGTVQVINLHNHQDVVHLSNLQGLEQPVFSPDARWVGVVSGNTIMIIESGSGNEEGRIIHNSPVTAIAFTPDDQWLISGSSDGTLSVSKVGTDEEDLYLRQDDVTSVAISRNGEVVAVARRNKPVQLFSALTKAPLKKILSTRSIYTLAFDDDAHFLVSGNENFVAGVSDVSSGNLVRPVQNQSWITKLAFAHKSSTVACATDDGHIRIFRALVSGKDRQVIKQEMQVFSLAFSPDDTLVAVGGADRNSTQSVARIFKIEDGAELEIKPLMHNDAVRAIAFSPNGEFLATGSDDGLARVFEVSSGNLLHEFRHGKAVVHVTFSSDGSLLATASNDRTVRVISMAKGNEILKLQSLESDLRELAFANHDRVLRTLSVGSDIISSVVAVREYLINSEDLLAKACSKIGQNLTQEEWPKYIPEENFRTICPE